MTTINRRTDGVVAQLMDTSGNPFDLLQEDGCLSVREYGYAVAEGDVASHTPWVKIGTTPATIASNGLLWNQTTAYVRPTVAQQMEVLSSSTQDGVGGTGIRTLRIYYLDGSFVEKTTDIIMNGTGVVATTPSDLYRVQKMVALTCGTDGAANGTITLRHLTNTPIYDEIATGETASKSLMYTVPYGKVLFVTSLMFSTGANATGKRVTFSTKGTYDFNLAALTTGSFFITYTEATLMDSVLEVDLKFPSKFPAGTDLMVVASGETGAIATGTARGWLEIV